MKKINKFLYTFAAMGLALGALTSCDDDKVVKYEPAEPTSGEEVYFNANPQTQYNLSEDGTSFNVVFYRADADGAITVPVTVTPQEGNTMNSAFSFPSSVSFSAGEKSANYVVSYDIEKLKDDEGNINYDDEQQFLLTIDESYATPYGSKTLLLTAVIPAPWTYLGVGQYYDFYWGVKDDDEWYVTDVQFYQNELDKNLFRVTNPYVAWNGEDTYFEFWILQEGEVYYDQTVNQPDLVGYNPYFVEYYPDYEDDLYIFHPGYAQRTQAIENWVYNRVVDYQENGLPGEIMLAPWYYMFNVGGWDQSASPTIDIIFPGYEMLDTELEVEYEGILNNGTTTGQVLAQVTVGADLTKVLVGIGSGNSEDAISSAIQDGSLPSIEIKASEEVRLAFSTENSSGRYSVVAVGYVGDEVRSTAIATFTYTQSGAEDPNEGWTSLGYIEYTDAYVCAMYGTGIVTYPVEIQESQEYEGYLRLVNPYGAPYPYNEDGDYDPSINSYLYIDTWEPACVYVDYSEQTLDWGNGELTCFSYAALLLTQNYDYDEIIEEGLNGTLEDGIITFPAQTLLSAWGEEGWYYANMVWDPESTDQQNPWVRNEDGSIFAPFYLDLNEISSTPAGKASLKKAADRAAMAKVKNPAAKKFDKQQRQAKKKVRKPAKAKKTLKAPEQAALNK